FLGLQDVAYLELYVGNAKQAAFFFQSVFGFELKGYSGMETGVRDRASYYLEQENIRLIVTAPIDSDSFIAKHLNKHGDGVRDIAMQVKDVDTAYEETVKRGAKSVEEPHDLTDDNGTVRKAAIQAYGDTIHTFIDRSDYSGIFMPGFQEREPMIEAVPTGLHFVDHCVANVELGEMETWVEFYEDVMGFKQYIHFDDEDISTEYSALM